MDSTYIYDSQLCYESQDCQRSANSVYLTDCRECMSSAFLYDCRGCKNCFMSSNLRNKSYVFKNRELSKEEYEREMKELDMENYDVFRACVSEYETLRTNAVHRFASLFRAVNSSGNNLINTKNTKHCFTGEDLENVSYGIRIIEAKDSADLYGVGNGAEPLYDGVNVGYRDSLIRFSTNTFEDIRDATYCDYCGTSQYIFGCVGLRKKQYRILNKAYSKEEYESLIPKIVVHMNAMPYRDPGENISFRRIFPSGIFSIRVQRIDCARVLSDN